MSVLSKNICHTLNFNCVEILPSLLDKTKGQTIRPAWKYDDFKIVENESGAQLGIRKSDNKIYTSFSNEKPPRYKVGDEIKIFWNQRSKYEWFWKKSGRPTDDEFRAFENNRFNKVLGTGVITEVFEIKWSIWEIKRIDKQLYSVKELAEKDGFENWFKMQSWFKKKYLDDKPKKFYVYRWSWNK